MEAGAAIDIPSECRPYRPHGAARDLMYCKATEVLVSGGAGTGKTRAVLEKLHLICQKYPNVRGLICRKERASLSETTLVTWEDKVVQAGFFADGGKRSHRQTYDYPNGSKVVLGGLDNPIKIMSGEYDVVVVDEATAITEDDWEFLVSRLRNHKMPYVQAIAACNPVHPTHWLKQRADRGRMEHLTSRLTDNLSFYDPAKGEWTPEGLSYKTAVLDGLSGVRRERLLDGKWVAQEGRIFDAFDHATHVVKLDATKDFFSGGFFGAQDWGYVHPGVFQIWGLDGDGRMYLVYELKQTKKTIDWWASKVKAACNAFGVHVVTCDSAEPAYIAQYRRHGIGAVEAFKAVIPGITAMSQRLLVQPDGKPRLYLLDDSLVDRDESLVAARKPWSLALEMDSYVWADTQKEQPVKEDDDSVDCARYAVAHADKLGGGHLVFKG